MKRSFIFSVLLVLNSALTAQPGPISVNVRLYSGVNVFRNSEWNNWNVGISGLSNISSGILKYSDGSPSNMSAILSLNGTVADNGPAYMNNASICPDTVLRYTSYITSTRTLKISGLSNTDKYYLEFYASRKRSDGQITLFTIGNKSVSVSTDNNSSSAGIFSAVTPSGGSIVVTIKRGNIYNYLNGFKISKMAAVPVGNPPVADAGNNQVISSDSVALNGSATAGSNPVFSTVWTQISGPNTAIIRSASKLRTVAAHLTEGVYLFKLSVADNYGLVATSTVVIVNGAGGKRIGLIGSSTAAGYFNNLWPIDSSYARKLLHYYKEKGTADTLYNLAVSGANIYKAMPNWYSAGNTLQPVNVYAIDRGRNITKMLSLHPDIILCHYPTNNYDTLSIPQIIFAMRTIKATADSAGVPVFFLGTAPRGSLSLANHQKLIAVNDSIKAAFGAMAILYYDSVAIAPRSVNMNPLLWLSNDSVHINPKGHNILYRQIINANIFSALTGVYAGANQFIRLPLNSVSLTGAITSATRNQILSTRWTQVNGPGAAFIHDPNSLNTQVSNLALGTYVFELSGMRADGQSSSSTILVTLMSFAPPVVSAGGNQTVLLPKSSAILSGSASRGGGGPLILSNWSQRSGPNKASIESPTSLDTRISALVAGNYVFGLIVTDSLGSISYDSVVITVTNGKSINVRLYGGAAPFMNNRWNNWNVGTAASQIPVTSGLFKDEDGSQSTVSATLSIQGGLNDNGANYTQNATICPDTVLRFASYITSKRTLTIKGLDNASKYYIELYGSRKAIDGQITRFSTITRYIDVSTDNNTSQVAVFAPLSPLNGAIEITMTRVVGYNYINGFKIAKLSKTGTTASGNIIYATAEDRTIENSAEVQVYPNPVTDHLTIINKKSDPLRIEIFDLSGRRLILEREYDYTRQIRMDNFRIGSYILLITNERNGQSDRKVIIKI